MDDEHLSTMKSLKYREKLGQLSAITLKSIIINLFCAIFDGISFKSIGIIKKGAPILRD